MSRFAMTLTAAGAAAVAAIAVVALPAIGDSGTKPPAVGTTFDARAFAQCLSANGLAGAPTDPAQLKQWLADKQASDPQATEAAIRACKGHIPRPANGPGPDIDIQELISCVRSKGVDAPTDPAEFKRWLASQQPSDALRQCKLEPPGDKPSVPGKPDCGAPADEAKPPADESDRPDDEGTARGT